MRDTLQAAVLLGIVATGFGCAGMAPPPQVYSKSLPGTGFEAMNRVHVETYPEADDRSKKVGETIAETFRSLGVPASFGPDFERPEEARFVVTYRDRWMWDMSMYLLHLTVKIRNLDTGWVAASGGSLRTSLVREDSDVMAREIIEPLLGGRTDDAD